MVYAGRVKGGVVVLEEGVHLPEGQEVSVSTSHSSRQGTHSIFDIPTMSLGEMKVPFDRSELLDEMLEGRV